MAKIPQVLPWLEVETSLWPQERDTGQTRCPRGDAAATARGNKHLSAAAPTPCLGTVGLEAALGG